MRRREEKKRILHYLERESWPEIRSLLLEINNKDVIHHLFSALCSIQEKCKWHAVSSFGFVVSRMAEENLESARVVMRRFLWSLNDESGGIGWGAPESMAEVMALNDVMFEEYSHMLFSYMKDDGPESFQDGNFLELPALQQGVLWGVGRLLSSRREATVAKGVGQDLKQYLQSKDNIVLGLAAWCLSQCDDPEVIDELNPLLENRTAFLLYEDQKLRKVTVKMLAEDAIRKLNYNK